MFAFAKNYLVRVARFSKPNLLNPCSNVTSSEPVAASTATVKAMASQTLASTSLISPEAGIELIGRGVDEVLAVAANERQFDSSPLLR